MRSLSVFKCIYIITCVNCRYSSVSSKSHVLIACIQVYIYSRMCYLPVSKCIYIATVFIFAENRAAMPSQINKAVVPSIGPGGAVNVVVVNTNRKWSSGLGTLHGPSFTCRHRIRDVTFRLNMIFAQKRLHSNENYNQSGKCRS